MVNLKETVLKYRQHSGTITDNSRKAGELTKKIFECLTPERTGAFFHFEFDL